MKSVFAIVDSENCLERDCYSNKKMLFERINEIFNNKSIRFIIPENLAKVDWFPGIYHFNKKQVSYGKLLTLVSRFEYGGEHVNFKVELLNSYGKKNKQITIKTLNIISGKKDKDARKQ